MLSIFTIVISYNEYYKYKNKFKVNNYIINDYNYQRI